MRRPNTSIFVFEAHHVTAYAVGKHDSTKMSPTLDEGAA